MSETSHFRLLKGERNPSWKGGKTPLIIRLRESVKYKEWRLSVYRRDDFACRHCTVRGGALEAHHEIPFSILVHQSGVSTMEEALSNPTLWDVTNGVTLCEECHRKTGSFARRAGRKVSDADVLEILSLLRRGTPASIIASTYGISQSFVSLIRSGQRYSNITSLSPPPP
jgi:hypothetical protein